MAEKKTVKKETKAVAVKAVKVENRLKSKYKEEVIPSLRKTFDYKNVMQVPKLDKIILNMRMGDIKDNAKSMQSAVAELERIAGQKAVEAKAKKSVANFKLRENMVIGAKVTLRGDRMWNFFEKLVSIALPRVRDFKGVSPESFDGRGNFALGIKEQLIFPDITYDQIEKIRGFDVCIVTTASSDEEAKELLKQLGMPFAK